MKKTFFYILSLFALAGCFRDDRNYNMVDDSFCLTARQTLLQASVHTGSCPVGIAKNGKGQTAASVTVLSSGAECAEALARYNEENGTAFTALPESGYSLSGSSISYETADVVKDLTVSWDPTDLAEQIGDSPDYVIPILVKSSELTVNPDKNFILIQVLRSSLSVTQTGIERTVSSKNVEPDPQGRQPALQETITLDLESTNAIKNVGMVFPVIIDNGLVATYNQTAEKPAQAAPEGLVNILTPSVTIPESGKSATYKVEIDKSVLLGPDGKLKEFPDYVAPIRVDKDGLQATCKGEAFDLRGLAYGNMVTYIGIRYKKSTGSVVITREWGKFSTVDAAWNAYYGGTAGSDRNVALDDDYIYIAETNTTKNLWAISLKDPSKVRKLPVGTVKDQGIFYLSCPRILKNTDASINGGKDVLAVSSMNEGDPTLYIYDKGVGEDPSVLNMTTWASRRLGDTFTAWGSLQEGILFFKDFNSAQGTVTFMLSGKTSGTLYLRGRVVAPPVSGAGAYFPFPEDINAGPCTVRGGKDSWMCHASKDLFSLEGADNAPNLAALSGYYADAAFRYIEFGGKRYIAYSRQVSGTDGRLIVIEGKATDSWETILANRTVIYQAAIQENAEMQEEYQESPRSSGNSGMDLDVRQVGSDLYIAVVKQNVGLSLFKMALD